MKNLLKSIALAGLVSTTNVALADNYIIDTKGSHASINFQIPHLGYSMLIGRFNEFEGTFTYDESKPEASTVSVTINTASIDSNHAERDKHLRSDDFLDTGKFPEATFTSTAFVPGEGKTGTLKGQLTLRGVTRDIDIAVEHIGGGDDPWGGYRQGFSGTTTIALADFDINFNLGPASKEVELTLAVEGIRQ